MSLINEQRDHKINTVNIIYINTKQLCKLMTCLRHTAKDEQHYATMRC